MDGYTVQVTVIMRVETIPGMYSEVDAEELVARSIKQVSGRAKVLYWNIDKMGKSGERI